MKSDLQAMYFKSKRNIVQFKTSIDSEAIGSDESTKTFLPENEITLFVEKQHKNSDSAKFESNRLALLYNNGLAVPRLLSIKDNIIEMEYVNALTLPDLINMWEETPDLKAQERAAGSLVGWLEKYYKIMSPETRGDINGRNFLFDGEKVWGVDFEEPSHATIAEEVGLLLAYILTYSPEFTQIKKAFANQIAFYASEAFDLTPDTLLQSQATALEMLNRRRKRNRLKT